MKKGRYEFEGIGNKRMLSVQEACFYTGMGQATCRKWLDEIGAIIRVGRRIYADKVAIDAAIDGKTISKREHD